MLDALLTKIERDGFAVLPGVFDGPAVEAIGARLAQALSGTTRRRRILHFEFSGRPRLPDGFEWHDFYPGMPHGAGPAG
jgi:hypothetical protein